jgi:hypothetical protein
MYTDEVIKKKQGKKSKWSYYFCRFREVYDSCLGGQFVC